MTLDLLFRSMLRDVVREVVREELAPSVTRPTDAEFITYSQAATLVGLSTKTIKQWAHDGRLCTYGEGRSKRLKPDEVRACFAQRRRAPTAAVEVDDVVAQMLARSKR